MFNSFKYWELRYAKGRNSGKGSYGKFALYKAKIINDFIKEHNVNSVIDFGCGDGNQAFFLNCSKYVGYDISNTALEICRKRFKGDSSKIFTDSVSMLENADLGLSCDVIFHLVEYDRFLKYLQQLFMLSNKYVIIYSSNEENDKYHNHIKHRKFTLAVLKYFLEWKLVKKIVNKYSEENFSDFYIYEKKINND